MRRQSGFASYHYSAAIPSEPRVGGHKGNIRAPAKSLFTEMHLPRWERKLVVVNVESSCEFSNFHPPSIRYGPEELIGSRRSNCDFFLTTDEYDWIEVSTKIKEFFIFIVIELSFYQQRTGSRKRGRT